MVHDLIHRLRALVRRPAVERELDAELRHHVELQIEKHLAAGLPRGDALRRAQVELGGLDWTKEAYRDSLGTRGLEDFSRDLRHALRMIRRTPLFAVTVIVTVALGVGANTVVFSVMQGLILRPLPVADPDRVWFAQRVGPFVSHSFPTYRELRARNRTFADLAGYRITMMQVETPQGPAHTWGYLATGSYFDLLGVKPARGRFFGAADDRAAGASPFAVLGYDYWQTAFGGRDDVVGATIRINRQPYTVVGIAGRGFLGTEVFYRPAIWVPMMMQAQIEVGNPWLDNPNTANTWVIGRLANGVGSEQGEADLNRVAQQVAREQQTPSAAASIRLTRPGLVGDALGGPARTFALGLLTLAGLVLLTACANLAGALAARGADRQRELALRIAIGASRGRLLRQLLTETLALVTAGGAIGLLGAALAARALSRWAPPIALPVQFDVQVDARVIGFALAATAFTAFGVGCAPAWQAVRAAPHGALNTRDGHGTRRWAVRDLLVAAQVAICVVLLGASLFAGRGLWRAMHMPLGIEPEGVTMASFDLGLAGYSREASDALRARIVDRLRAIPGVQSVAYANSLPLNIDQSSTTVHPDDRPDLAPSEVPRALKYQVSPGFFTTLGIRLLEGRDLTWQDRADTQPVAVVNDAFVRQILRGRPPIGRRFRSGPAPATIVGVVETGKYQSLTEAETPVIFEPMLQAPNTTTVILARSTNPDAQMGGLLRQMVRESDPALPLFGVRPVAEMLGFVRLPMTFAAAALAAFGVLAVALAATGIHGLAAYAVARRRRELAIRVAVGAPRHRLIGLVLRRTMILVAVGTIAGLAIAAGLQGVLTSLSFQAAGEPPSAWALVVGLVALVTAGACWWPTWRALRVDPVTALAVE